MRLLPVIITCLLAGISCNENKKNKSLADADLTLPELVSFFSPANFPYRINDSLLTKKENDSSAISIEAFKTFIPDSVYTRYFGKKMKPKLVPLAKGTDSDKNIFLFVKSESPSRKAFVFCFTPKLAYINAMMVAETDKANNYRQYCEVSKNMNFKLVQERKTGDKTDSKENNYFLDNSGQFRTAVIINTKDLSDEVPVNPIDTLPGKNKYSGDYLQDKKNIVSVRDGANAKFFLFFIHFSKQKGECTGELKGRGEFIGNNKGMFTDKNGPCKIYFDFTSTRVSIREEGCGSYRGITCFFEGSYLKKKEPVKPKEKKKKQK